MRKVNINLSDDDIALIVEALGQYVRFYDPDESHRVAAEALRKRFQKEEAA